MGGVEVGGVRSGVAEGAWDGIGVEVGAEEFENGDFRLGFGTKSRQLKAKKTKAIIDIMKRV